MNINFTRVIICSITALFLFGCLPLETPPVPTTPLVELQVLEPMMETPVLACVCFFLMLNYLLNCYLTIRFAFE